MADRAPVAGIEAVRLEFLLGRWSIERAIVDRHGGACPAFSGEATVTPVGPGRARYEERGVFTAGNGHRGRARRTLLYRSGDAATLAVSFADGRPFVDLDLDRGGCEAEHPCGADLYRIAFAVADEDTVIERWRVRGPHKDYDAETVWRRAGGADERSGPFRRR